MAREVTLKKLTRDLVVAGLRLDLVSSLSRITGNEPERIERNFRRRIRRNHPGLSAEYVEEEMIRRIAEELQDYTGNHPDTTIERSEVSIRDAIRHHFDPKLLESANYHFPLRCQIDSADDDPYALG